MKTHPLLSYRLKHPLPIEDDIKGGDYIVLKEYEINPSTNAQRQNPKIRRARMNYSLKHSEVKTLQRNPIRAVGVYLGGPGFVYVNLAEYLGRTLGKDDHGFRWFLISDVRKVN